MTLPRRRRHPTPTNPSHLAERRPTVPFGLDTKSIVVGLALGFFVAPIVVGKVRKVTGKGA